MGNFKKSVWFSTLLTTAKPWFWDVISPFTRNYIHNRGWLIPVSIEHFVGWEIPLANAIICVPNKFRILHQSLKGLVTSLHSFLKDLDHQDHLTRNNRQIKRFKSSKVASYETLWYSNLCTSISSRCWF
jgi:hypothetical protein